MRQRVGQLDGTVKIESRPGEGTVVSVIPTQGSTAADGPNADD